MTVTILALDVATTTGWACSDGTSGAECFDGRLADGRALAKLAEPERHAVIGSRLNYWLHAKVIFTRASVLLVERQMTHHRAHLLLGLRMIALFVGWQHKMLVEEVWSSQWRPWARANGDWVKGDEADARAILSYWQETRLPRLTETCP